MLLPNTDAKVRTRFSAGETGTQKTYQTDYLAQPQTIAPGAIGSADARLFAGAKEVSVVGINVPFSIDGGYNEALHLNHFDLLIDWGWFYFITKPMFLASIFLFHLVGNFGIAILIFTVLVKMLFFPLANKSYASMAKMKAVQPEMAMIKERYADDKMKQQQAMMELYKKDKINPVAGCLPIAIQIPVFFSLYKVLSSPSRCGTRRSTAGSTTFRRRTRPTSSPCSDCCLTRRRCRCSAASCISASGRPSWASRCGCR